jgi:dTDP-4-amino-4,6-dideoxygalactose transaminase
MVSAIAEIGINQLHKVEKYNQKRRQIALRWDKWCENHGYRKPLKIPESVPIYLRYPVLVEPEKKRDTSWALKQLSVSVGVWFVSNIHPTNISIDNCPNANKAVKQCINFPTLE